MAVCKSFEKDMNIDVSIRLQKIKTILINKNENEKKNSKSKIDDFHFISDKQSIP